MELEILSAIFKKNKHILNCVKVRKESEFVILSNIVQFLLFEVKVVYIFIVLSTFIMKFDCKCLSNLSDTIQLKVRGMHGKEPTHLLEECYKFFILKIEMFFK